MLLPDKDVWYGALAPPLRQKELHQLTVRLMVQLYRLEFYLRPLEQILRLVAERTVGL